MHGEVHQWIRAQLSPCHIHGGLRSVSALTELTVCRYQDASNFRCKYKHSWATYWPLIFNRDSYIPCGTLPYIAIASCLFHTEEYPTIYQARLKQMESLSTREMPRTGRTIRGRNLRGLAYDRRQRRPRRHRRLPDGQLHLLCPLSRPQSAELGISATPLSSSASQRYPFDFRPPQLS